MFGRTRLRALIATVAVAPVLALAALSAPATADVVVVGNDAGPPVVSEAAVSADSADVSSMPADVTVSARVTDDLSGVSGIYFYLQGPTTSYGNSGTRQSGTALDGTYAATITIPKYAPAGNYRLGCQASDLVSQLTFDCGTEVFIAVADHSVDLKSSISAAPSPAHAGDTVAVTATVSNSGPARPVEPSVSIPVPAGTTLVSAPAGCARVGAGPVVCPLPADSLDPGEQVARAVQLRVADSAASPISASATASSASEERTPEDNIATLTIPVVAPDPVIGAPAKLSLSTTVSPERALPGDTVTYTLTARNAAGAGDAAGTVVTDTLPRGVTFLDASESCAHNGSTVRCDLGTVGAGSSKAATIRATVDPIPMAADPNTAHQVGDAKSETDLRLEHGQTASATASCPAGFLATDGGVRLEAVDQGSDLARVSVPASGPTPDSTGWRATVTNPNPGAAQVKVTVTCLARTTVTGDHQHGLVTTTSTKTGQTLVAGGNPVTVDCAPGQTPIAPSYSLTSGAITASQAAGSSWRFQVATTGPVTGDFAVSCLDARTTTSNGHYHLLGIDSRTATVSVPAGQTVESQLTCDDLAKGVVASTRLDSGLVSRGNDSRGKTRAFRFTNPTGQTLSADIGLTCLDIRTSAAPVATAITNTATVSTTTPDTTTADDSASATFTAYGDGWAILPAGRASVGTGGRSVSTVVRCASDCTVSARLATTGGRTLASGRASMRAAATQSLTLRSTASGARILVQRHTDRARLVVTTSEGATFSQLVRLQR